MVGGVAGQAVGDAIEAGIVLLNEKFGRGSGSDGSRDGGTTRHGQDRMSERGVSPERVQEARDIGRVKPGNTPETVVREVPSAASASGRGVRVVFDRETGRVVTVIDKGSRFR